VTTRPLATINDPDRQEQFLQAIGLGLGIVAAADYAGIPGRTAKRWMQRGRDAIAASEDNASPVPDEEAHYAEFAVRVLKARSDGQSRNLAIINRAAQVGDPIVDARTGLPIRDHNPRINPDCEGPGTHCTCAVLRKAGDYRAATWLLERTDPDNFAPTTRTELSGPGGGPVVSHSKVDVEVSVNTLANPQRLAMLAAAMQDAGMLPRPPEAIEATATEPDDDA